VYSRQWRQDPIGVLIAMSKTHFQSKVVLVTGAARGIGKNIARLFAQQGATTVIADIDEPTGRQTEAALRGEGAQAEFLGVDLSRPGAPQEMVREVVRRHGRLDCLVNNARSGRRVTFLEETEETWERGLAVTLRAAFFASQEAVRVMDGAGGSIVNIASVAGERVGHESPAYHIARAGVIHMTRYLAAHAGPCGVRVNCVLPGFIVQDEHRDRYERDDNAAYRHDALACHPLGVVGSSDDVARAVLFLCSPEAAFIHAHALTVDGGVSVQDQFSLLHYRMGRIG
jgi:NAD(P)-dependent dehydrogenase (short-subunit alcohol dehydrogenase family)